jgi:hypothetical protein
VPGVGRSASCGWRLAGATPGRRRLGTAPRHRSLAMAYGALRFFSVPECHLKGRRTNGTTRDTRQARPKSAKSPLNAAHATGSFRQSPAGYVSRFRSFTTAISTMKPPTNTRPSPCHRSTDIRGDRSPPRGGATYADGPVLSREDAAIPMRAGMSPDGCGPSVELPPSQKHASTSEGYPRLRHGNPKLTTEPSPSAITK